ncbi:MAG: HAMP domain-containing protein [[Clostridium] scindens]
MAWIRFQQIADVAGQNALVMVQEGEQAQISAVIAVIVIIIFSAILAALIGLRISNSIRKPVDEIEHAAQELAKGELDAAFVTYKSEDELGGLSGSIRELIDYQKAVIDDIDHILRSMSKGSFIVRSKKEEYYKGRYKRILISLREMRKNLSNTLWQISQSSEQVSLGSEQVLFREPLRALAMGTA